MQVIREVAVPAEEKRKPVSGEAEVGFSNRGSYYGLGLNIDFTKPKSALLSTRMNARIVDDVTGEVLMRGRDGVAMFGSLLHVTAADEAAARPAIAARLRARGIAVRSLEPIEPSLEDAFVAIIQARTDPPDPS